MPQICSSFDDRFYTLIVKKANELDVQKSKAVTFMAESYFVDTVRLQEENQQLKEQLGFLRSEFDRIHREIQEPLKLLAAGPASVTDKDKEPLRKPSLLERLGLKRMV